MFLTICMMQLGYKKKAARYCEKKETKIVSNFQNSTIFLQHQK